MTQLKTQGIYRFDCFGDEIIAAFSGREFPRAQWNEYLRELGLDASRLVTLRQIHSANLVLVQPKSIPGEETPADGLITRMPGAVLGIQTADCIPVFFWDPEHQAVGIVHAGWRGLYYGINQKAVQAFRQNFLSRPAHLQVAIGPSIRKCCYEVGAEFKDYFPRHFETVAGTHGETIHVDLAAALKSELISEGVDPAHIHDSGYCTSCRNDAFFSYRREKETPERILSVMALKS